MKRRSTKFGGPRAGLLLWIALLSIAAGCSGGDPIARLRARIQLKEGNRAYLAGQYKAAIQRYDAAARDVPRLAPAYLNKAYSQEALFRAASDPGDRKQLATDAVEAFNRYLDLRDHGGIGVQAGDPDSRRVEEHVVTLLVDSRQYDEAINRLKERYERNPRDTSALEMLSRLDMERGNLDEAMDWQRKRVEAEPDNPDAQYSLGAFVWLASYRNSQMDPGKRAALLDEGLAALNQALSLRPTDFETLIYINLVYLEKAKYATGDEERSGFEAQAKSYRDRALALRKGAAAADSSQKAPSGAAAGSGPAGAAGGAEGGAGGPADSSGRAAEAQDGR